MYAKLEVGKLDILGQKFEKLEVGWARSRKSLKQEKLDVGKLEVGKAGSKKSQMQESQKQEKLEVGGAGCRKARSMKAGSNKAGSRGALFDT